MTTIVYKDGVMVADSRAWAGHRMPLGTKRKIHRLKDGSLLGVSSATPGIAEAFRDWLDNGFHASCAPSPTDWKALLVKPDGSVFYYLDTPYPSGPLTGDHFAIGSGEHFALGALAMGADAVLAAEIAADLDQGASGGPLLVEHLDPAHPDQLALPLAA